VTYQKIFEGEYKINEKKKEKKNSIVK
jgi:hypothetical protein